jgi:hypothetical protein
MPSVFVVLLSLLTRLIRDWKLEKETRFLIEKKNQIMTSSKNSGKIAILKISSEVSKLTLVNYIPLMWFDKYQDLAFDTIRIYTYLKPQNDCLNLSFVKDEDTYVKKMARKVLITVL